MLAEFYGNVKKKQNFKAFFVAIQSIFFYNFLTLAQFLVHIIIRPLCQ